MNICCVDENLHADLKSLVFVLKVAQGLTIRYVPIFLIFWPRLCMYKIMFHYLILAYLRIFHLFQSNNYYFTKIWKININRQCKFLLFRETIIYNELLSLSRQPFAIFCVTFRRFWCEKPFGKHLNSIFIGERFPIRAFYNDWKRKSRLV